MMKMIFILILNLFLSVSSFAISSVSTQSISKSHADKLAIEFQKSKLTNAFNISNNLELMNPNHCYPEEPESCVQVLCDKTGSCNFESNFSEIAAACRGSSGSCVKYICDQTGGCSFISNAKQIAQSCRDTNGKCVQYGCEKTGSCSFTSNAQKIASICQGVYDSDCVIYGCNRTGSCSFVSNFEKIARSCAGY